MTEERLGHRNSDNAALLDWVERMVAHCQPEGVFWCSGSAAEREELTARALASGDLIELNQERLPGCYYHRSHPNDVARVEERTFICTEREEEAGPTNHWAPPGETYERLYGLLSGGMKGRILYVVPYLMGPPGSPLAKVGIELTDSLYVVLSMGIMTRVGTVALHELGRGEDFNRGLHSQLNMDPEQRFICHFPQDNAVISVNSAYGGNALLGKKCLSLRIGSYKARREGWLAEHMLILGVESPTGEKTFVAAAFPSACGKTNFAMLVPPAHYQGWKVWTVGDDIAWMNPGPDGRLYAVNPEFGHFGVVPGTNQKSNPTAMRIISRDTIYTNVALRADGTVWWEGLSEPPAECLDWKGDRWTPQMGKPAAHPNSRFAAPMTNNPFLAPEALEPQGVPISAIIFGGRRAAAVPLLVQAFDWSHGVFLGATMASEMTAAASGGNGQLRRDPMAMVPFCGYHISDYFRHWLSMGQRLRQPPRIFHVNWFRRGPDGEFLWPGFGENMRVLKWICDRCHGRVAAVESPLGWMPHRDDFDLQNLNGFGAEDFARVQRVDAQEWLEEIRDQDEFFGKLRDNLPKELVEQRRLLMERLGVTNV